MKHILIFDHLLFSRAKRIAGLLLAWSKTLGLTCHIYDSTYSRCALTYDTDSTVNRGRDDVEMFQKRMDDVANTILRALTTVLELPSVTFSVGP